MASRRAVAVCLVCVATPLWAQGPLIRTPVDLCAVASEDQLKPLLASAIGRHFPLVLSRGADSVIVANPGLVGVQCPGLRIDLAAEVEPAGPGRGGSDDTPRGMMRWTSRVGAQVTYAVRQGGAPRRAGELRDAVACVEGVEVTTIRLPLRPAWLHATWVGQGLARRLAGRACFDATALVSAHLARLRRQEH